MVDFPGFFAWTTPEVDTDKMAVSEENHLKSVTTFAQPINVNLVHQEQTHLIKVQEIEQVGNFKPPTAFNCAS